MISNKQSEHVPPMEEEEPEPKEGLEAVQWHAVRAMRRARQFVVTQPVVALLILVAFIYLVVINRKLNRMERAFYELLEMHRTTVAQLAETTTTTNQKTSEQVQDI